MDLALKDRPKSAPAASPADASPPPKSTMSRSYSGQSLSSETSFGPPACLHVLVLGEGGEKGFRGKSDGVSSKRGSIMAVSRSSFRYAILDEAQTSRMYYRAIISKSPKVRCCECHSDECHSDVYPSVGPSPTFSRQALAEAPIWGPNPKLGS